MFSCKYTAKIMFVGGIFFRIYRTMENPKKNKTKTTFVHLYLQLKSICCWICRIFLISLRNFSAAAKLGWLDPSALGNSFGKSETSEQSNKKQNSCKYTPKIDMFSDLLDFCAMENPKNSKTYQLYLCIYNWNEFVFLMFLIFRISRRKFSAAARLGWLDPSALGNSFGKSEKSEKSKNTNNNCSCKYTSKICILWDFLDCP